jgi:hypothetical protein
MRFLKLCENIINKLSPLKPKDVEKKLGIKYNGVQEGYKTIPSMHLFTDSKTGSTFAVSLDATEKDVEEKLNDLRKTFQHK